MAGKVPLKKPRLNNLTLGYLRREPVYEAVLTDLVLMGAIDKDVVEKFTGVEFAKNLKAPPGFVIDESAEDTEDDEETTDEEDTGDVGEEDVDIQ